MVLLNIFTTPKCNLLINSGNAKCKIGGVSDLASQIV